MKILFVQLPLPGHGHEYIQGNVTYAAAVMSAYCNRFFPGRVRTESLPPVLADFGSDSLITRYINGISPDMICFTVYLWNIERSLSIAEEVRRYLPGAQIVMGGPEISAGSWALAEKRSAVNLFVSGEGEWFLSNLLTGKSLDPYLSYINGNPVLCQPPSELIPPDHICEPFMDGYLNAGSDHSIFMELTRGCPYRCSYCYYSRNCLTVRELPFSYLTDTIRKGRDKLREIYILSPTFDRSAGFRENLHTLSSMEHNIRLHTEMKAGGIDRETAELLYSAGFRSLEVGLQTLNTRALAQVGRKGDPMRELLGMKNLRDAGIDLKIGIIPGLPGDSPSEFLQTVEILTGEGLGDFIELYPLMILPGTAIRERAITENISFQAEPPYYYTGGWGIDMDDIHDIGFHITEKTGFRPGVYTLPDLRIERNGQFCRGVIFPCDRDFRKAIADMLFIMDTHVFTFFYMGEGPVHRESLLSLAEKAGSGLFHHVFFRDEPIDEEICFQLAGREGDSFHTRMNLFQHQAEGWRNRFSQVFRDQERYLALRSEYSAIEPIFYLSGRDGRLLRKIDPEVDSLMISGEAYPSLRSELVRLYGDYPERLAFEVEDHEEDFYRSLNLEWIKYPYKFFIRDMTGDF